MRNKIRIIELGNKSTELVHNLVVSLNQIQKAFDFNLDEKPLKLNPKKAKDGIYDEDYIWSVVRPHWQSNYSNDEYPMVICHVPLPDETFSSSESRGAIVSTFGIERILEPDLDLDKFLKYVIMSIVIDQNNEYGDLHKQKTLGCPNDYCDDLSELNIGMRAGSYCKDCNRFFHNAIEKGDVSLLEYTSVYRVLDKICGRRICFVLTPFNETFNPILKSIEGVVTQQGYTFISAKDLVAPREIMQIIYEMIQRAEIIIADLTGKNPNVFFEVGYANACKKSTILITQDVEDVPFDLGHRHYLKYSVDNLSESLTKKLEQFL